MGLASGVTTGFISAIWFMELVQDFVHALDQDFDQILDLKESEKAFGGLPGASGGLQKVSGATSEATAHSKRGSETVLKSSKWFPERHRRAPSESRGVPESFQGRLGGVRG